MENLTQIRKGPAAEAEVAAAVTRLDLVVLRPMADGGRYDLVVDTGSHMIRVQCKWASRHESVLLVRCLTSRHTPRGYLRTTYSADEIDAIAAYSPDTDNCYLIPIEEIAGRSMISFRLAPTRNNQDRRVRWARDYELIISLERHWGVQFAPQRRFVSRTG
jgi:hypothetical protein